MLVINRETMLSIYGRIFVTIVMVNNFAVARTKDRTIKKPNQIY